MVRAPHTVDPRYLLDPFEPAYLALHRSGELEDRLRRAREELTHCEACPRDCGVDRTEEETGVCRTGRHAMVSSAFPHFGEEDCLRGTRGSGTIFFSLCNLKCVFCQNWDISQRPSGKPCTAEELAGMMLRLQGQGCHNVNLVTPEHVVPQVVEALAVAVREGLRVPVVYNTSAYDSVASLRLMEGLVDIYMPDFKFWDPGTASRLCGARDYPECARAAVAEMHRQVGPLRFGPDGVARRGVLVRHLVMPGQEAETRAILNWLAGSVSRDTHVNVMGQYRPAFRVGQPLRDGGRRFDEIATYSVREELRAAYAVARELGLRLDERGP